jgi:hypothetical protein
VLERRPPDRQSQLETAQRALTVADAKLATATDAVDATRRALDGLGALAALSRRGRAERRTFEAELIARNAVGVDAAGTVARAHALVARLTGDQAAHDHYEQAHGWRRQAISDAWDRLDEHWTGVALAFVRADQALAYGVDPLRIARQHLNQQLAAVEATIPPDRSHDRAAARREVVATKHDRFSVQQRLQTVQRELDQLTIRRWPRRDNRAIARCGEQVDAARQVVADSTSRETVARHRLDDIEQYQQARACALQTTADDRRRLAGSIHEIEDALDRTRVQRVEQLLEHPGKVHLDILGLIPAGAAGRAVWCHQAHRLEFELDRYAGDETTWRNLVRDLRQTPDLARIAEQHIQAPGRNVEPPMWSRYAARASELHAAVIERPSPTPNFGIDIG